MAADPCPPAPRPSFDPLFETIPAGTALCRIHSAAFPAAGFNLWTGAPAKPTRFAPFEGAAGTSIPTLYAAKSFSVALAESLFHDLPREQPDLSVSRSQAERLAVSWLRCRSELRLISFRGAALRRLRVDWNRLIGSDPICYARTQPWSRAAHRHRSRPDGIVWSSRQFDGEPALMLFGDRVASSELETVEDRIPLTGSRYENELLRECELANILLRLR